MTVARQLYFRTVGKDASPLLASKVLKEVVTSEMLFDEAVVHNFDDSGFRGIALRGGAVGVGFRAKPGAQNSSECCGKRKAGFAADAAECDLGRDAGKVRRSDHAERKLPFG